MFREFRVVVVIAVASLRFAYRVLGGRYSHCQFFNCALYKLAVEVVTRMCFCVHICCVQRAPWPDRHILICSYTYVVHNHNTASLCPIRVHSNALEQFSCSRWSISRDRILCTQNIQVTLLAYSTTRIPYDWHVQGIIVNHKTAMVLVGIDSFPFGKSVQRVYLWGVYYICELCFIPRKQHIPRARVLRHSIHSTHIERPFLIKPIMHVKMCSEPLWRVYTIYIYNRVYIYINALPRWRG